MTYFSNNQIFSFFIVFQAVKSVCVDIGKYRNRCYGNNGYDTCDTFMSFALHHICHVHLCCFFELVDEGEKGDEGDKYECLNVGERSNRGALYEGL